MLDEDNFEKRWEDLLIEKSKQIDFEVDFEGLLFLIGLQELGKTRISPDKNQKLDIMHIAVCKLLEPYGFYEYKGIDADGWPHWERLKKIPNLDKKEQDKLIRTAMLEYFED